MNPAEFGRWAQQQASRWFQARGYRVLAENYNTSRAEIDLVVSDGAHLVFVEVKARRQRAFGSPWEAVDAGKRRRIVLAASHFWARHPHLHHLTMRFDVVAIEPKPDGDGWRIRWLRDAFSPDHG